MQVVLSRACSRPDARFRMVNLMEHLALVLDRSTEVLIKDKVPLVQQDFRKEAAP